MINFSLQCIRIPAALAALMLAALALGSEAFVDVNNLDSLQTLLGPIAIAVVGMTLLFIIGQFDLSVGAVMGLGGIVAALALDAGLGVLPASLLALASGALIGAVNGALVAWLGINPLIATLAMLAIVRGVIETLVRGLGVAGFTSMPPAFTGIGNAKPGGLYAVVWIALLLLVLVEFGLARLVPLRRLYFIGGSAKAAALLGLPVRRTTCLVFVAAGTLAALAGLLVTARVGMANRYLGVGVEMEVIIACLIGGAVLRGGRGSALCATLGALFMALLKNGFNLMEVAPQWQGVVLGAILVAVVVADGYAAQRQRRLGT
jgi:ribose transport system permease protein